MVGRIGCLPAIVVLAAAATQSRPAAPPPAAAESRAPVRWVASVADPASALRPGDRVAVQLSAELEAGWHLYSLTPVPQGPAPTIVGLSAGQPFSLAGDITEPLPQTKYDPTFDRDTSYFEDAVTFVLPVKVDAAVKPGAQSINVLVSYQVCDSHICLPPARVTVAAAVTVGRTSQASQASLLESVQQQVAARDGLAWSGSRRLTWDDFKGTVPEGVTEEAAHLEYGLFYGARCTGQKFDFRVIAAMIPGDSWVRRSVVASPADNARILQHEQTHFNLTELRARKMRAYMAGLYEPCLRPDQELETAAEGFVRAEAAEQARYDEETRNGRDADKQRRWDTDVATRLAGKGA
jgi:thiol:disulfide interchange protein DsbD